VVRIELATNPAPVTSDPTSTIDRRGLLGAALGCACTTAMAARACAQSGSFGEASPSLHRTLGRMMIMGYRGSDLASAGAKAVARWLEQGLVGGVIFSDENLPNPHAALRATQFFAEAAAPVTPFLCVDQEGGAIARLRGDRGFVPLPAARNVALTSPQQAALLYDRAAGELHRLGFNVNFGPDVDLALNAGNPIIVGLGRSFGSDPKIVVDYAKAFIDAHRRNHVLTALKHFPARVRPHRTAMRLCRISARPGGARNCSLSRSSRKAATRT
jgi:Glycosyl hydrolase family 3 N terminal domain